MLMVRGPASGTIAAAFRLGWTMPSHTTFKETSGHIPDLRTEAPLTIRRAAWDAFETWSAGRLILTRRLGGLPDLEPLRAVCASRHTPRAARASLIVMAEGGWPSQQLLHTVGKASSPHCPHCPGHIGNLQHETSQQSR